MKKGPPLWVKRVKVSAVVVLAFGFGMGLWVLFSRTEMVVYVDEVTWQHHVRLLEDYTVNECSTEIDSDGNSKIECHDVERTRERQHEMHQGTNGLDATTWPTVRAPVGSQYVEKEAEYRVKFHRDEGRWSYRANSIPDAKRFKPGKMWLIKTNMVRMVWPVRETGVEG